jgi:hypothetical protein
MVWQRKICVEKRLGQVRQMSMVKLALSDLAMTNTGCLNKREFQMDNGCFVKKLFLLEYINCSVRVSLSHFHTYISCSLTICTHHCSFLPLSHQPLLLCITHLQIFTNGYLYSISI